MAETVAVLFGKKAAKIGELQLDATISESHRYTNKVSEFPVEEGQDITDNIRLDPEVYSINGLITNTPIEVRFADVTDIVSRRGNINEAKRVSRDGTPTKVESAQDIMLRISGRSINGENMKPEIIDIVTGLRVFTDMAITNFQIDRDGATGQAMPFSAEFQKIRIVTSETITLPTPQPASRDKTLSKVDKGNQTKTETNPEQSILLSGVKGAFDAAKRLF